MNIRNIINNLNDSKIFLGIIMILNILGNNYIIHEITKRLEHILKNACSKSAYIRIIFIFSALFIVIRDIEICLILSILGTLIYKNIIKEKKIIYKNFIYNK